MPISTKNIHEYINACQSTTNDSLVNTQLTGAICALNKGAVYSVPTLNDLPSASQNEGRFVFVEDIGAYRFSDGIEWTNDYESTLTTAIYGWGRGFNGRIGDETTIDRSSPVQEVSLSTDWCQVSGGNNNSLALKTSGTLWAWGQNNNAEIGDGTTTNRSSPVQEVSSSTNWCQVSGGGYRSLALKTSGTLWGWGDNGFGQIGDNTTICRSSPVQEVTSSTDWCQVSASSHSLALKKSGTLWGWGSNFNGRIGDGTTTNRSSPVQEVSSSTNWCQVSGGSAHSLALKTSGTLWAWGDNGGFIDTGKLGDGTVIQRSSPVQEVSSSTNWCQVSGGSSHSLALKTSGTLWAWGCGSQGKLGDGTTINKSSPVQEVSSSTNWCQVFGNNHSLALKTDNTLWAWGSNLNGIIGDGTVIQRSSPVQEVSSSTNWCQVSGGRSHSLAIEAGKGFI